MPRLVPSGWQDRIPEPALFGSAPSKPGFAAAFTLSVSAYLRGHYDIATAGGRCDRGVSDRGALNSARRMEKCRDGLP